MFAVIRNELWQRRWSLLWWSIGVGAFVALDVALYTTVKSDAQQLNQALSHLPGAIRSLFSGGADFLSPTGFLSARIYYLLLPLLLTILSIGLGSSLIGKEEKQGTLELLLARPISRTRLLIGKVLAGLSILTIVSLVALIAAVVTAHPAGTGIAALVAFASYLIASLESLVDWLAWPAKASVYHYYHPNEMLGGASGSKTMVAFAIGIVALGIAAWLGFRRRDLDAN